MMFGYRDTFEYFQCRRCGCVQISETPKDVGQYYPAGYYSLRGSLTKMHALKKFLVAKQVNSVVFGKGLIGKVICMFRPPDAALIALKRTHIDIDSKLLEVGSGTGYLLYKLKIAGFRHLTGVDPFIKKDITYSPNCVIFKGTTQGIDGSFNLILFDHSFEHIPDQLETLMSVQKLLENKGTCIIRMPTASSYAYEHYGPNWVQLDPPRHLFIHSIHSLKILLEKAKLKLVNVVYDSTKFQFWGSEQYQRGIPLNSPKSYSINPNESIFSKKDMNKYTKWSIELNENKEGDQAVFYIEKQ